MMTSDDTPDRSILPNGTKGYRKIEGILHLYIDCAGRTVIALVGVTGLSGWGQVGLCTAAATPGGSITNFKLRGGATRAWSEVGKIDLL
jgi:hypothetical protein